MKNDIEFSKTEPALNDRPTLKVIKTDTLGIIEKFPRAAADVSSKPSIPAMPDNQVSSNRRFDIKDIIFTLPDEGLRFGSEHKFRRITLVSLFLFFVIVYALFYFDTVNKQRQVPAKALGINQVNAVAQINAVAAPTPLKHKPTLEELGNTIIHTDDWQSKSVDSFLHTWESLNPEQREKIKQSTWYPQFFFRLERYITTAAPNEATKTAAVVLAYKFGILMAKNNLTNPSLPVTVDAKKTKTAAVVNPVPTHQLPAQLSPAKNLPPEHLPLKQEAADNVVRATNSESRKQSNENIKSIQTNTKTSVVGQRQEKVALTTTSNVEQRQQKTELALVSEDALNRTIARFIKAYEAGDIKTLEKLFSHSISYNDNSTKSSVKNAFQNRFSNSTSRTLQIRNMRWEYSNKMAKGVGTAAITTTEEKQSTQRLIGKNRLGVRAPKVEKITGKIEIQLKKIDNDVVIINLLLPVNSG